MDLEELLNNVPPIARYHREPLPVSQNALSYWSDAAEAMTPLDADLWGRCSVAGAGESRAGGSSLASQLGEMTIEALRDVIGRNQGALTLLDRGVRCGRVQFPEFSDEGGSGEEHGETMSLMRDLARLWWASARLQFAEGRPAESARQFTGLGEMGHLLCCGESFVMHYLMGSILLDLAGSGIALLAAAPDVPAEALEPAHAAAKRWIDEADRVIECQRVELCSYAIPELVRLSACGDTAALIDQFIDRHYQDTPLMCESDRENEAMPDDGRGEWRRESIHFLLADHPDPFSLLPSVRCLAQLVADRMEALQQLHSHAISVIWRRLVRAIRYKRLQSRIRIWPAQLGPAFPFDCLGPSDSARRALTDLLQEHLSATAWRSVQLPTRSELEGIRAKLRRRPNILGSLIIHTLLGVDIAQSERLRRARLEAARQSLVAAAAKRNSSLG